MNNHSVLFDQLDMAHFERKSVTPQLIASTFAWLRWIDRLRVLSVDSHLLHEVIPVIKSNQATSLFRSLECLTIRHTKSTARRHDPLADILELGDFSSLRHVAIETYQPGETLVKIGEICRTVESLETLTIEFGSPYPSIDMDVDDELREIVKKRHRCHFVYRGARFLQIWLGK